MEDYDGVVGIFSRENILSFKLKEKFSQKYLDVKIFDDFNNVDLSHLSYLIINLLDFKKELPNIGSIVKTIECKVLVLHPLFVSRSEKYVADTEIKNLISSNPNLGVLLVPEVLGQGVVYNPNFISHDLIMQSVLSERIKLKSDSLLINTISVSKLAERIVRDTFSFGISGEVLAVIGARKNRKTFTTKYLGISEENIITTKEEYDIAELYSSTSVQIDFSLNLAVRNTKKTFSQSTETKVEESLIPLIEKVEHVNLRQVESKAVVKKKLKRLSKILIFIFFVSFTPFYLILVSTLLLFISAKIVLSNNSLSSSLMDKSIAAADAARSLSFGNNFIYDTANIIYEFGSLGYEGISLVNIGRTFVDNITSDEAYDLSIHSNKISASLDKIHTDISFLQSDINELDGFVGDYFRNYLINKRFDVGEYKVKIYEAKNLFSRISILLGSESPQKYLVLFQNNMELRPTGGFIGSFATITFDKGRLSEIVVNDVYTADGQLKGHIDPPEPIRRYLGEGGWYLRDSNWDPNFPVSATKAEWFLDKEIGEKVDGVIAIDLHSIKRLMEVIGPINLTDFNITVDSNNLYQIIQSEVEDEFFPGSIKKATILTSLSRSLITEVENLDSTKYLAFFKELYESLERRHIQIYLHDSNAMEAVSALNYSGEINIETDCGLRCLKDGYALIDANLGVNKSNYFIKRSQEINLSVSKEFIGHELFVTYDNLASPAIGNMGVYKNYARVLLPSNSKVGGVRVYETTGEFKDLEYDLVDMEGRREVGFLVELLPGTQKRVQIVWNTLESKLSQGGQYDFKIIKQAGTEEDKLTVNIRSSDLTLTGKSLSSYNTTLARDFKARMFFKP